MTRSRRARLGRAKWQALLAKQAASGLAVAAFCSRQGVSVASFYLWRSRLRAEEGAVVARPLGGTRTGAFVDLRSLALGDGRLELRLDLGGGVQLSMVRG